MIRTGRRPRLGRTVATGALALFAAACGGGNERREPAQNAAAQSAAPAPPEAATRPAGRAPEPAAPAPPPAVAPGRDIVSEAPFDSKSAQGAANVVQTYFALIEAGKYEEAWRLRWTDPDLPLERFRAHFARYSEYHATVGAPSEIQGAAGSLYVEVPVQLYGRLSNGKPFGSAGTITLRRVNDVPGSTAEERSWRIYTSN
ncbi:MAG: hypothetical protein ACM3YM_07290 [Sphingomonadales bacterium]